MFTKSSNLTKSFEGLRIEIETPVDFDTVMKRLHDLTGRASVNEVIGVAAQVKSAADYAREIETRFVGKSGFIVFAEVDHGNWIHLYGIRRRSVRVILGNPLIAITMLCHDLSAGLFAPVEMLVTASEEGSGTQIIYLQPSSLMCVPGTGRELRQAAEVLDAKLSKLVSDIAQS